MFSQKNLFTDGDVLDILSARTPEVLSRIAIRVMKRLPGEISLVCGPITTGSNRTPDENRRHLNKIAAMLRKRGVTVFNQLVFLKQLQKVQKALGLEAEAIRARFDLPILETGRIKKVYMKVGWRRSEGTRWYHDQAERLGIPIGIVELRDAKKK